jgi:hypothetical protein
MAGMVVWFFQSLSAYLSHRWSVQRERWQVQGSSWYSLGAWAVYTRLIGNTIAIANTLWIVIFSFLQFTNLYNNCWCASSQFQKGLDGFVLVLATPAQIYSKASAPWIGGTFMAITCDIICVLFFTLGKGDNLYQGDAQ